MKVFGIASRFELIDTDKGQSVKFRGDFIASEINGKPGAVRAATCYLPRAAEEMLEVAIERATHDATDHATGAINAVGVQFGFRIFQRADDSAIVGYTWGVESLIDFASAESDPLLALMAQAGA